MKLKNVLLKTIIGQVVIDVLVLLVFYFLIPNLMNYSTYSVELNFVQEYQGLSYFVQALFMFLPYTIIMLVFLLLYFKDMILYGKYNIDEIPSAIKSRLSVRLINTPFICYLLKLICFPISVSVTLIASDAPALIIIKLTIIITVVFLLDGAFIYTYAKSMFKNLIKEQKNYYYLIGKRNSLKKEIFIQFMSINCACLTFMLLLSYSRIIEEKGDAIYYSINNKLSNYFDSTDKDIKMQNTVLLEIKKMFENNDEYIYFSIDPNGNLITLDNKNLPDFTHKIYIHKMVQMHENRIYDVSKESQGIIEVIDTDNGQYIYGIFYTIIPLESVRYFLYAIMVVLMLNILIIIYYSFNMSKNISEISSAIELVASGNRVDFDKKLPVTSNDEIGELVIAFNKILELEKENIETKERNQSIMVEQERLSSLGQLIGGIAHNLKTPIMSIAGVAEGLTDLIKEYDESIDDPSVTKEDHHEIAKDMQDWVDKVKPYLSYMTEVINTVKGQAVSMNASTMTSFSAKELISRVNILLRNELKRRHCVLNLDVDVNENTSIAGEISAIVQVLDNLVINAMDAYKEDGGNIDIKVREDEDKVYIEVKDYGCGIPEKVQDKLFKEMVTSKGKNGTGLGLYMSFSTIKGKFKGDIRFETEEGRGTTFFIELPKYLVA